jgi:cell division septation protein DedD
MLLLNYRFPAFFSFGCAINAKRQCLHFLQGVTMSKASGSINSWLLMGVLVLVIVIGGVVFLKQMENASAPPEPQPAKRFKIPPQVSPQAQAPKPQPAESAAAPTAAAPEAPATAKKPEAAPADKVAAAPVPAPPEPKTAPAADAMSSPEAGPAEKTPVAGETAVASAAPAAPSPPPVAPAAYDPTARFPFSVSLGSYSSRDNAVKVIEKNRNAGLMPYSVKVNLGSRGTWYRVFLGYFPSKEAADQFIADNGLKEAKTEKTRYAAQIGVFPSHDKLKSSTDSLTQMGYYPYTLQRDADQIALLIGAFYAQSEAQKHCQRLTAAGMRCEAIER